jgi:MSHA biogenesis protein MshI
MFDLFRKKKPPITVGIQLSEGYIALLALDCRQAESPKIIDYVNYSIDQDTVASVLELRIKEYIESNHLKNVNCCLVLDDQDYQLLVLEAPSVPASEIADAVKWKIKDLIQFPVSEAIVDVFLQPDGHMKNKNIANVVVSHKDIIEKKVDYINSLGLNLVAIDIPELSYRNYFERVESQDKNIALIILKEGHGKIIVIQNGSVYFSRGFNIHYKGGLLDDVPETEVVLEVQRSLDYYERQLKQMMPSKAIFIGENITKDKITEITKNSLSQEVLIGGVDAFTFSEEDVLATFKIMATYGASLRYGLLEGAVS